MRRTEVLQEGRKMRFEEAYQGWQQARLPQSKAASLLGVHFGLEREALFRLVPARGRGSQLHLDQEVSAGGWAGKAGPRSAARIAIGEIARRYRD